MWKKKILEMTKELGSFLIKILHFQSDFIFIEEFIFKILLR